MSDIQKRKPTRRAVPKIEELYAETRLETLYRNAELRLLLNADPHPSWIKVRDGVKYIPIRRVKWLLSQIFVEWHHDILFSYQSWNGVVVAIRLHYRTPDGEWLHTDGIGGAKLQFKKGTLPLTENIVQDSIERSPGVADSNAIKNAAKNLGRLFGADLNKKDEDEELDYGVVLDKLDSLPITEAEIVAVRAELESVGIAEQDMLEFLSAPKMEALTHGHVPVIMSRITSRKNHEALQH